MKYYRLIVDYEYDVAFFYSASDEDKTEIIKETYKEFDDGERTNCEVLDCILEPLSKKGIHLFDVEICEVER